MDNKTLVNRLLDLQSLLFLLHEIERYVYLPDNKYSDRHETDTEHSYSLAMTAWFMCGQFPELNKDLVIRYALAHDLVEIHAGDVMAIGRTVEQEQEKQEKEAHAIERLKADWPDFQDMTDTIEAYERQADPEAVFVKALDKIMAPMINIKAEGKLWKKLNISRSDVIANKDEKTSKDPRVHELWQELRQRILDHDEFFNSTD